MYRVCEASLAFEGSVQGSDILLSSFWFQKGTSVVLCWPWSGLSVPQCVNGVYLLAKDKLIMVVLSVPGKVKIFSTYTSASVWERLSLNSHRNPCKYQKHLSWHFRSFLMIPGPPAVCKNLSHMLFNSLSASHPGRDRGVAILCGSYLEENEWQGSNNLAFPFRNSCVSLKRGDLML